MAKNTFKGGLHPLKHEGKLPTKDNAIRSDFVPESVVIPMAMHLGAPSVVCVAKGDKVKIGQVIGEPQGFLGLPVHASISGTVTRIEEIQQLGAAPCFCVVIDNDFENEKIDFEPLGDVEKVDITKIVPAIKAAGICGMGGATFPTHVKLTIPDGKTCDTIIVNGAECETHLTSDYRLMLETPNKVVDGLRAVMRALNVSRGVISIEDNKPEAIAAMNKAICGREGVSVAVHKTKYPQGSEKQLIHAVTGRQVPTGALPIDAQTIVINAATAAAIADAIIEGAPLTTRITTVTGCVANPSNVRIPIGTVLSDLIGFCGGYSEEPGKIILGGAMTGPCAPNERVSLTKGSGGVIVVNEKAARRTMDSPCIRCARCTYVCPMGLAPYLIRTACDKNDDKTAEALNIKSCILCGCCSYICPANRYLTPAFKIMKENIAAKERRQKK